VGVCDDLRLTVRGDRIVRAEGACVLAEPWLLGQNRASPPAAEVEGQAVRMEAAVARAATLLRQARSPLVYGLARSSTRGQSAAVTLAEALGATS
jgi:formylmethanofuran dehydrogenase subunit B